MSFRTTSPVGRRHDEALLAARGHFQMAQIVVRLTVGAAHRLLQLRTVLLTRTLTLAVPLAVRHAHGVVVAFDVGAAVFKTTKD